jgi:hypothetical protein
MMKLVVARAQDRVLLRRVTSIVAAALQVVVTG